MIYYNFLFFTFCIVQNCQAFWHWNTVTIMKKNYRSNVYDSSILDPKINCFINNRLIIHENKPLYEKMVKTIKKMIQNKKSITVELTNIVLKDAEFLFYWNIHWNLFHRLLYIDGLSIYKTDYNGNIMDHHVYLEDSGCKKNGPPEFYINPQSVVRVRKK